jgi:hypothetical protein
MKKPDNSHITRMFIEGKPIDDALRRAVQRALWEHKQLGQSIVVWEDGKIVVVPPEEIDVEKPPEDPDPS